MIKRLIIILVLLAGLVIPFVSPMPVMAATEMMYPDADGVYSEWTPGSGSNYQMVDEVSADEASTKNTKYEGNTDLHDSFIFPATSGTGTINSITLNARFNSGDAEGAYTLFVRVGGTNYYSSNCTPQPTSWTTFNKTWSTNPDTSSAWTWSDLDSLEAGYRHRYGSSLQWIQCTQFNVSIDYDAITAPDVTINAASNIAQTTARLNSTVVDDGGQACDIRWGWGETTQSAIEDYDSYSSWENDTYTLGQHPYNDITSLTSDTLYYFRVEIRNDYGTELGAEDDFTTASSLNEPDSFNSIPGSNSVSLSWEKGIGATNTLIRYSVDTYPTTTDEGTQVYFGSSSSTVHSSLESGITIYYSAWGESGDAYSASYITLLVTTLAGQDSEVDLLAPTEPTNWFLNVDYTTQVNNPFYETINNIADSVSIPRSTAWMISGIFLAMIGGGVVYGFSKNLLTSAIVMCILMVLASAQLLIPGWIIFLAVIILIGFGLTRRRIE